MDKTDRRPDFEKAIPFPAFPLNGEGECRVFMNTQSSLKCDVLEGRQLSMRGQLSVFEPAKAKVSFHILESDGATAPPSKKREKAQEHTLTGTRAP